MKLRDLGNSLIVVEHDEDTMLAADCIVDIGSVAGEHGGQLVAAGTPQDIMDCKESITGAYLSRKTGNSGAVDETEANRFSYCKGGSRE